MLEGILNDVRIYVTFLRSHTHILKKLNTLISMPGSTYYQFLIVYVLKTALRIEIIIDNKFRNKNSLLCFITGRIGQRNSGWFFFSNKHNLLTEENAWQGLWRKMVVFPKRKGKPKHFRGIVSALHVDLRGRGRIKYYFDEKWKKYFLHHFFSKENRKIIPYSLHILVRATSPEIL